MYFKSQSTSPSRQLDDSLPAGLPSSISAPSLLSIQQSNQPFKGKDRESAHSGGHHKPRGGGTAGGGGSKPRKNIYNNSNSNSSSSNKNSNRTENKSDHKRSGSTSSSCIYSKTQQQQQQHHRHNGSRGGHHSSKRSNRSSVDSITTLLDKSVSISSAETVQLPLSLSLQQQAPPIISSASATPEPPIHQQQQSIAGDDEAASCGAAVAASSSVADVAKKPTTLTIDFNLIVMEEESLNAYVPLLQTIAAQIEERLKPVESIILDDIPDSYAIFDADQLPTISVFQYLRRILKYTTFNEEIFVMSVIYLDRLRQLVPPFQLHILNIHRLILTSALLSSKYQNEKVLSNRYYAQVGGISLDEMNVLELALLDLFQYDLFIAKEEYDSYLNSVQPAIDHLSQMRQVAQLPHQQQPQHQATLLGNSESPIPSPPANPNNASSTTPSPSKSQSNDRTYRQKSFSNNTNHNNGNFAQTLHRARPFHNTSYNTYPQPHHHQHHNPQQHHYRYYVDNNAYSTPHHHQNHYPMYHHRSSETFHPVHSQPVSIHGGGAGWVYYPSNAPYQVYDSSSRY